MPGGEWVVDTLAEENHAIHRPFYPRSERKAKPAGHNERERRISGHLIAKENM
jgi:hypothetical protein